MRIGRTYTEGGQVPWGYGVAWYRVVRGEFYLLPVPLNWIAGVGHRWLVTLTMGPATPEFDLGLRAAREAGYRAGLQDGKREGHTLAQKQLLAALEKRAQAARSPETKQ